MGPPVPASSARPGGYSGVQSPFSMDDGTFRDLGHRLVDLLAAYLDELPREPVYRPLPTEVRRELEEMNIPVDGAAPEDVIEGFARLVLPYGRGQNHPCFAAFVDPAASKLSMLAAFASAVTNTSGAGGNYAAIYVGRGAQRLGRQGGRPPRPPAADHVHVGRGPFLPGQGRVHAGARRSAQGSDRCWLPHGPRGAARGGRGRPARWSPPVPGRGERRGGHHRRDRPARRPRRLLPRGRPLAAR